MKKLLISIIIILIAILIGITVFKGIEIGNFTVLGISDIKQKNDNLDNTIKQATKLASTDYQKNLDSLDDAVKKLETEKASYEDMVNVSTESEIESANQEYSYEIDFLWIRLGNHAKSEGIKMDVSANDLTEITSNSQASQQDKKYRCNLNFTVTGSYIGIASFIEDIEDDSKLGFKIEDFKMNSSSEGTDLQGTFTCKEIIIKGISTSTVSGPVDSSIGNTTDSNTTNTTNNTVQ